MLGFDWPITALSKVSVIKPDIKTNSRIANYFVCFCSVNGWLIHKECSWINQYLWAYCLSEWINDSFIKKKKKDNLFLNESVFLNKSLSEWFSDSLIKKITYFVPELISVFEWILQGMIQWPTHKDSTYFCSWIQQCFWRNPWVINSRTH